MPSLTNSRRVARARLSGARDCKRDEDHAVQPASVGSSERDAGDISGLAVANPPRCKSVKLAPFEQADRPSVSRGKELKKSVLP